MGYVPGFEYDVYFSYADGEDVRERGQPEGWVSTFLDRFKSAVTENLAREPVLFRDDLFSGIDRSALFLAVVSPRWSRSEFCDKELNDFLQHARDRWPGLTVGNRQRVLKVLRLPAGFDAPLPEILGYEFYGMDWSRATPAPLSPDAPEFGLKLDELAQDAAQILKEMRRLVAEAPATPRASASSRQAPVRFVLRSSEAMGDGAAPRIVRGTSREASARTWTDTAGAAAELAEVVSLAARVEPSLLRLARLHLGLRVEREAEVWFSPLIEIRNANGVTFFPEALDILRARLRSSPERLELAIRLTMEEARQAALPPATRLQEQVNCEATPESAAALRQVLVAIVREKRTQLASWAAGALARLPETVRQQADTTLLAQAVRASGVSSVAGFDSTPPPPTWMTPTPAAPSAVGVRLSPNGLNSARPRCLATRRWNFRTSSGCPGAWRSTGERKRSASGEAARSGSRFRARRYGWMLRAERPGLSGPKRRSAPGGLCLSARGIRQTTRWRSSLCGNSGAGSRRLLRSRRGRSAAEGLLCRHRRSRP